VIYPQCKRLRSANSALSAIIIQMPLGLYISVPFCRTKCTYCNFSSDVFSRAVFENYITHLCGEIVASRETAEQIGGDFDHSADSIYLGGGTPTLLDVTQLDRVFVNIRQIFHLTPGAEITMECAPGTLSAPMLEAMVRNDVNRVSLGVQSFIDQEAASVGRLHKRSTVLDDIGRLRAAGIENINVDLIAGLPHQSRESWQESLGILIDCGVSHASIYMLEIDEDSRLGRELIAGGQKYHAHFVPDEDLTAELYELACAALDRAGIAQYEISNFARSGFESTHNLKYWNRRPYLGFGVDAHSMLQVLHGERAVRFSNPERIEHYLGGIAREKTEVDKSASLEEAFFLGLRLNRGIDLAEVEKYFGCGSSGPYKCRISELLASGLLFQSGDNLRLTPRGRLLSNEVFQQFLRPQETAVL
jgi:oxygen-independent coproporphyrinogen-3 oxidase